MAIAYIDTFYIQKQNIKKLLVIQSVSFKD